MRCCKCGEDKPRTEFYLGRTECKPCKKSISWADKKRRMGRDSAYRETRSAAHRRWKSLNRDKVRVWNAARRLKERPATSGVAKHCRAVLERQKWRCAVCRADLKQGKHLDHVIPLAAGGLHEIGNFQWLCPGCNLAKSAKHPVEFMQSRGFLI